ncbi:hypothetical protein [Anaerophilus nitritogenes]|uniref:hypothetical protein n=1 Tax=Anaerophilus nitritogenes TaxID=2498136 RepID=UPI00101BE1BF|nr:hypothetical protein [Anaerophilus nitritogenes]
MMKEEQKEQGKISLVISALISLVVGLWNIKSSHYFYGITMLIVFVLVLGKVVGEFKNEYITKSR